MKYITDVVKKHKKTNKLTLLDIANELGVSSKTLIKRLKKNDWKKTEIYYIKQNYK